MKLPEIDFGKLIYDECEHFDTYVKSYKNVTFADYMQYVQKIKNDKFAQKSSYKLGENSFSIFADGNDALYLAYYPAAGEMRVVTEPDSAYLSFCDNSGRNCVQSLITQIEQEDFGLSYVLRISDGRFIIFDGGNEWEIEADKLMKCMREQSPHEKPVIAAWVMTHPHLDHYRCYFEFEKKYLNDVIIERFIYNFPEASEANLERVTALKNGKEMVNIPRFNEAAERSGAPIYTAHTGQVYTFGDTKLEILSSPDDTFCTPIDDFNTISLIIKVTIAGQTIMMTADGYFENANLAKRWGTYLKSDILQVPHHGFCGGRIEEYDLIDPAVCMVPVSANDCFVKFNIYEDYNKHLIYNLNVQEYIVGNGKNVTLPLPYTPKANGRKIMLDMVDSYQKSIGAKSWFFEGLTSADCDFTFINASARDTTVFADLLFEDFANTVWSIKIAIPSMRVSKRNILNCEDVDDNALFYNKRPLKKMGVPDGVKFTVHFTSDKPVVIKGKTEPVYFA